MIYQLRKISNVSLDDGEKYIQEQSKMLVFIHAERHIILSYSVMGGTYIIGWIDTYMRFSWWKKEEVMREF